MTNESHEVDLTQVAENELSIAPQESDTPVGTTLQRLWRNIWPKIGCLSLACSCSFWP